MDITVALLVGTVRSKRESIKVANFVAKFAEGQNGIDIIFVDPQTLSLPDEGEDVKDTRYSEITEKADAFIIVTPEYNHSFPGSLKRMLDSEYENYHKKPVALVGVSNGSWGGVRVCEALMPVCHRLGLVNIHPELYFPKVQDIFTEAGDIKQEYESRYNKNTQALLDELLWFARLLKESKAIQE